jgi:hypothetical protein
MIATASSHTLWLLRFQGASDFGAVKANLDPFKIFTLGILSGCHIGFGNTTAQLL